MTEYLTHQEENATTEANSTAPDWTVTKYKIRIADIRLLDLTASVKDPDILPSELIPAVKGILRSDKRSGNSFEALVSFEFPAAPESQSPIFIKGSFSLRFSHKEGLSDMVARYYARLNAPILAYPYIREVISDYSSRALGKVVLIPPLDVPAYIKECTPSALKEFWPKRPALGKGMEHSNTAGANHGERQVDVPHNG